MAGFPSDRHTPFGPPGDGSRVAKPAAALSTSSRRRRIPVRPPTRSTLLGVGWVTTQVVAAMSGIDRAWYWHTQLPKANDKRGKVNLSSWNNQVTRRCLFIHWALEQASLYATRRNGRTLRPAFLWRIKPKLGSRLSVDGLQSKLSHENARSWQLQKRQTSRTQASGALTSAVARSPVTQHRHRMQSAKPHWRLSWIKFQQQLQLLLLKEPSPRRKTSATALPQGREAAQCTKADTEGDRARGIGPKRLHEFRTAGPPPPKAPPSAPR